jgi:glyceraldehyde 3-phosphate dehydrogenase
MGQSLGAMIPKPEPVFCEPTVIARQKYVVDPIYLRRTSAIRIHLFLFPTNAGFWPQPNHFSATCEEEDIMTLVAKNHPYLSKDRQTVPMKLGINGLGRIGKLSLWHHVSRKSFDALVVNVGRKAGTSLEHIADYVERDTTYGSLGRYIHGFRGGRVIEELDEVKGEMRINGVPVTVLRERRNPKDIGWKAFRVNLVVDCTGVFRDPTARADEPSGSLRGHLEAGARKVILSAPFKIRDKSKSIPDDAVTNIQGINEDAYIPKKHLIISGASCTTTCLSFMVKPLLDHFGPGPILSASMVTVHAATSGQEILDQLPPTDADDLRKNRSLFNNIILTTTGAADTLVQVIPAMKQIGFVAESVRVPVSTGSIVVLGLNIQDDPENPVSRGTINRIYREAANGYLCNYLSYSDSQNVSSDMVGTAAAAVIEGRETRAHTGRVKVNLGSACRLVTSGEPAREVGGSILEIPVTRMVVYGWYDNELGSFCNILGESTIRIARSLLSSS